MKLAPRTRVLAFKVRPTLERSIRQHARRDGRTVSSFLSFYLEAALAAADGSAADTIGARSVLQRHAPTERSDSPII